MDRRLIWPPCTVAVAETCSWSQDHKSGRLSPAHDPCHILIYENVATINANMWITYKHTSDKVNNSKNTLNERQKSTSQLIESRSLEHNHPAGIDRGFTRWWTWSRTSVITKTQRHNSEQSTTNKNINTNTLHEFKEMSHDQIKL